MQYKSYQQIKLEEELVKRKKANASFSLRSFALYLNVDPSALSKVLKGERVFSQANSLKVVEKLRLKKAEKEKFLNASIKTGPASKALFENTVVLGPEDSAEIIESYEYYAFIDLMKTKNFKLDFQWIARKLSISLERGLEVFETLKRVGLIEFDENNTLRPSNVHITTTEDVPSKSLKNAHMEACELAKKMIQDVEVELRDYSIITVPTNLKRIPVIKQMIRSFRKELIETLQDGECEEVYQMNIQLFPISKVGL